MLFGQDSDQAQAHAQLTEGHQAKLSHEFIAAAASYEAAKAYEHHLKIHGKPANHAKAVELLSALTGGFIDRIAETKGVDAYERERAKHVAHEQVNKALGEYGGY